MTRDLRKKHTEKVTLLNKIIGNQKIKIKGLEFRIINLRERLVEAQEGDVAKLKRKIKKQRAEIASQSD